jgi:DNA replication protein DnaC
MDNDSEIFRGTFAEGLAWAQNKADACIAEIGEEAYRAEREEKRQRERDLIFRTGQLDGVKRMIGPRHADCTFENFEVNDGNRHAYEQCRQLADTFGKGGKGVLLCGRNGIGKNHLAAATARSVAWNKHLVFYGSITTIKNRMYDAMGDSLEGAINSIMNARLICVNDLGAEQDTRFGRELMFSLIDRIYEQKAVLLATTNIVNDQELCERYGKRVLSRLWHMCDIVVYDDRDHRVARQQGFHSGAGYGIMSQT